jgi:hypothetical protein
MRDRTVPGPSRSPFIWKEHIMFGVLAVILVVAWFLGFSVFHVAGGIIHVLLLLAVVSILWHFISGRRTAP